jgi:hypothetical protein
MATPRMTVDGNHDRCPICKKNPKTCPHSLNDMDIRLWEDRIRKIVREELAKLARPIG